MEHNKYELLINPHTDTNTIICYSEQGNGKFVWEIYVPDAGDLNVAKKLVRLLNQEYREYLLRLGNRNGGS